LSILGTRNAVSGKVSLSYDPNLERIKVQFEGTKVANGHTAEGSFLEGLEGVSPTSRQSGCSPHLVLELKMPV